MRKALVIEGSPHSRMLVANWLREEEWDVIEASNGEQGVRLAKEHRPAAIVCALLMPQRNGYEVCRTIRDLENWLEQPRIIVTAASDNEVDRLSMMKAGADDYLVKPIRREQLMQMLTRSPLLIDRSLCASGSGVSAALYQPPDRRRHSTEATRRVWKSAQTIRSSSWTPGVESGGWAWLSTQNSKIVQCI